MFVLFIGGSEISKVPGLSAAGSNVEALPFTSPADADMVWWGRPRVVDVIPVDPQGHPTPAIITRAAREVSDFSFMVVRSGSFVAPVCPYMELGITPGGDMRIHPSVPDARTIFEECRGIGAQLGAHMRLSDPFVLGESVPGGTTSALCVLRAMGYEGMVSCAGPENPISTKEQVMHEAFARTGTTPGDLKGRGLEAVYQFGDPMQAAAAGFLAGLPPKCQTVLAGGTQMLAVAAIARAEGVTRPLLVATTRYVAEDKSANFTEMAEQIGVQTYSAQVNFSKSRFTGLSDYERGYVKEGVGAGGAVWYAEQLGVSPQKVCTRVEELYAEMTGM